MTQELVQFLEGQGGRARMARGYLAQEIEVVSNEDREVPSEGRLVNALRGGRRVPTHACPISKHEREWPMYCAGRKTIALQRLIANGPACI